MVKGISRQVIVVHSPEPKLFEQAIFILNDEAVKKGVTEDTLLKEAKKLMAAPEKNRYFWRGALWAGSGALATGALWLLTVLL
ncbi:MAG: translation initiation factor 2 [Oscillospiraceae bacterium]|nr:translation initiation factor 2 [Oscillospiraceae bacterium]